MPEALLAAPMRMIHNLRIWRFFTRRSRVAYDIAFMTAILAIRKFDFRVPQNPEARSKIFFFLFFLTTGRLTLAISFLYFPGISLRNSFSSVSETIAGRRFFRFKFDDLPVSKCLCPETEYLKWPFLVFRKRFAAPL